MVYENYKIYGPYVSSKDGRSRIVAVSPDGNKRTVSYPKYLIECYLDRYLVDDETVDHIDCDFTNNEISNLRVIDRRTHVHEDVLRAKTIDFTCEMCNTKFFVSSASKQAQIRRDRRNNKSGPFCSKSCAGRYGAYIQNGYIDKLKVKEIKISEKYRLKAGVTK